MSKTHVLNFTHTVAQAPDWFRQKASMSIWQLENLIYNSSVSLSILKLNLHAVAFTILLL